MACIGKRGKEDFLQVSRFKSSLHYFLFGQLTLFRDVFHWCRKILQYVTILREPFLYIISLFLYVDTRCHYRTFDIIYSAMLCMAHKADVRVHLLFYM